MMKQLYNTFIILFLLLQIAGCKSDQNHPSWTEVVPFNKNVIAVDYQRRIDQGYILDPTLWDQSQFKDADTREAIEVVISKLPYGIETRLGEKSQHSLLRLALMLKKSPDIVQYLIELGSDVTDRNFQGETLLHFAVMSGKVEMAKILLDNGADPNASNIYGHTTIFQCVTYTKPEKLIEMYNMLVKHGANPHVYRVSSEGSSEYTTPYDDLKYRWERFDLPEAESLLSKMIEPPSNFRGRKETMKVGSPGGR